MHAPLAHRLGKETRRVLLSASVVTLCHDAKSRTLIGVGVAVGESGFTRGTANLSDTAKAAFAASSFLLTFVRRRQHCSRS